ncbi:hypothetical protein [Anabaena sp. 4-3]|uniref:hypothetical protein n=1 Tax=Anabaena sp. 4-3 TaxID=1811979 RepID=UPI0008328945|nr:hypothetical protein [Anabaena sp. 4-3]
MRFYLYILAGITSALIGWNIGQFFLTDIGLLTSFPEIILFPCIAISLAFGMVMNEIFISNPTRIKINFRIAKTPLLIAIGLGILAGLIAGLISQILFLPFISVPTPIVRTLGWLLIGCSVGIAEGLSWRWHSLEAGEPKRFKQRFLTSVIGASAASLVAAVIFEFIRTSLSEIPAAFKSAEDPLGFSLLGLLLGLVFSFTNSPSYMAALRAGTGFEFTGFNYQDAIPQLEGVHKSNPYIDKSLLTFVNDDENEEIEEGLSIQLPSNGIIKIGSAEKEAHIYIPGLPLHVADIVLKKREAFLTPDFNFFNTIEVNGERLVSRRNVRLRHNYVLTFHTVKMDGKNEEKMYRFVYYNRFLDPQS